MMNANRLHPIGPDNEHGTVLAERMLPSYHGDRVKYRHCTRGKVL